jgi:hypothetical protein
MCTLWEPISFTIKCQNSTLVNDYILQSNSRIRMELSSILILLASCRQTCITYTIAVCTVKNSWRCTEELSETCRVSSQNKFEKLVHLFAFIIRYLSRCTVTWTSKAEARFNSKGTTAYPCTPSYPTQGPNFYFSLSYVETEMYSIKRRFPHCYECRGNALVCTCTASTWALP